MAASRVGKKVLFFGTDAVAVQSLRKLKYNSSVVSHIEVVCPEDQPAGRKRKLEPCPTKIFCKDVGIPFHAIPGGGKKNQTPHSQWYEPLLPIARTFDVAVVVSFGYFLPPSLLESFRDGAVNMHPSLLPKYRGAAPIEHALLNDEKETGVSVIDVHPRDWDAGKILVQKVHPIGEEICANELSIELGDLGANCLEKVLENLSFYQEKSVPQTKNMNVQFPKAPKLKTVMGKIDWHKSTSDEVFSQWRALTDRIGVYTFLNDKRVKVLHLEKCDVQGEDAPPGTVVFNGTTKGKNRLLIRCRKGWIGCTLLQIEGKKAMKPVDFANGQKIVKKGSIAFR
eukprot:g2132.t1